jgi:hypothetical protein
LVEGKIVADVFCPEVLLASTRSARRMILLCGNSPTTSESLLSVWLSILITGQPNQDSLKLIAEPFEGDNIVMKPRPVQAGEVSGIGDGEMDAFIGV